MATRTRVTLDILKVRAVAMGAAERGVNAAVGVAANELVDILSQPGTGRIYRRGTVTHQASAPGEPPAVDTGQLRQSVHTSTVRHGNRVVGKVGASSQHAVHTELGTEKMAPRPHTSRLANEPEHRDKIVSAFQRGARG